ncbi:MAG: MFS transporter [Hyphomicrobiaceae bacterium]
MAGSLSRTTAPFAVHSFRLQWPADLMTSLAFEMETLILGWYILTTTGSVFWLTVFAAMQFHGTLVSPLLGVIGDRIGHRNLLCCMRAVYVGLAATLLTLAASGLLGPVAVVVVASLMGIVRPSDLSVRAASVAQSIPADLLVGALGISRTTSDVARIAGALTGAGVLAKLGMAPAYMIITAIYAGGLVLLLLARTKDGAIIASGTRAERGISGAWRDLKEGMAYVRSTPRLLAAVWLAFLMNMTTLPLSGGLLPFVAKGVYGTDQTGLGYLSASFAAGAFIGSFGLSLAARWIRLARAMMLSGIIWCVVLMVFATTTTLREGVVLLLLAGVMQSVCLVSMAILLLKTSEERLRGRVMGVRMLAIISQVPGLLPAGLLIERFGFSATAQLYSGGALLCTILIWGMWHKDLWPPEAVANVRTT